LTSPELVAVPAASPIAGILKMFAYLLGGTIIATSSARFDPAKSTEERFVDFGYQYFLNRRAEAAFFPQV
jgi:hypothetical protein